MNNFAIFNNTLGKFASEILFASQQVLRNLDFSKSPLNTQYLNNQLRQLIPIEELRSAGSFFTCDELGITATNFFEDNLQNAHLILDPACGAGNLLLACSKKLPLIKDSLLGTLSIWGRKLAGLDIHKEFIEATKIRLILEAISRGAQPDTTDINQLISMFPFITVKDFFQMHPITENVTHIIINPPFYMMPSSRHCDWGRGKINSAAVFLEICIKYFPIGTHIVAILPDVLRSGSRYKKWRELISRNAEFDLKVIGRFDSKTDVDVFLLYAKIKREQPEKSFWIKKTNSTKTIEKYFSVINGHVVPYRDKQDGPSYCYISPSILSGCADIHTNEIITKRQYLGTVVRPPFVVIRRTSSPSDTPRARATLIRGNQPVAVENHLVILKPKSGTIKDCNKLINILSNPETDNFLNIRIRCRHLTVAAIKEIPWVEESI